MQQLQEHRHGDGLDAVDGRGNTGHTERLFQAVADRRAHRVQHPRPVAQRRQWRAFQLVERVLAVDHQAERFGFEGLEVEQLAEALFGEAANHDVELVLLQHGQQVITGMLHHFDRQQWAARLDRGNGLRQYQRSGGKDAADADKTVPAVAQAVDLVDELLRLGQRTLGITHHVFTQLGGRHAAWQALEQGKAELLFEIAQHLAQGRLAEVHARSGCVHVAGARQGVDQHQVLVADPVAKAGMGQVRRHRQQASGR